MAVSGFGVDFLSGVVFFDSLIGGVTAFRISVSCGRRGLMSGAGTGLIGLEEVGVCTAADEVEGMGSFSATRRVISMIVSLISARTRLNARIGD
jgi:hypothetical protein